MTEAQGGNGQKVDASDQNHHTTCSVSHANFPAQGCGSLVLSLHQRNCRLMGYIRTALDFKGLYPPTTDVVVMANDLTVDFNRIS